MLQICHILEKIELVYEMKNGKKFFVFKIFEKRFARGIFIKHESLISEEWYAKCISNNDFTENILLIYFFLPYLEYIV